MIETLLCVLILSVWLAVAILKAIHNEISDWDQGGYICEE